MGYWLQRTNTSATVRYDPTTRTIQYQVPCAEPKGLYNAETYNSPCCIPDLEKICSGIYNDTMVKDDECQSSKPPFELQLCEVARAVCKENPNRYGNCNLIRNNFIIDNPLDQMIQGIKDSYWNMPYRFGNFSIDVRNKGFHNGSRGWGLWNDDMIQASTKFAWFFNMVSPNHDSRFEGFKIYILDFPVWKIIDLPDLDTKWHNYQIHWSDRFMDFYIDHKLVHSEKHVVIQDYLSHHVWVDNVNYDVSSNGTLFDFKWNYVTKPRTIWVRQFEYQSLD